MDRRPPDTDQDATLIEAGRSWDKDATLIEAGGSRDGDATLIETPVPARPGDFPPAAGGPVEAAAPLLIRLTQLKNTLEHPNPAQLQDQFKDQLAAFRQRMTALDPADRERAVRLLALTIDDVLLHDTAWGESWRQQGLLAGTDGGQQLQTLLGECLERRALLELIHSCLALGLQGGYRSYPERWRALREQVHRSLAVPATLGQSPPSARRPRPLGWLLAVLGAGLLLVLLGGMAADLAERRQALAAAVGELLPGLGT
ncbi:MAG: DotU family type IV/VI secretion system protein, partial [Candidatus Competibacteraceae bacterium]|nr:DotU family type IV/VI secretion system protein [Candidatus Competibacteraceae bacterium]